MVNGYLKAWPTNEPSGMGILDTFGRKCKFVHCNEIGGNILDPETNGCHSVEQSEKEQRNIGYDSSCAVLSDDDYFSVGEVHVFVPKNNFPVHLKSDFAICIINDDFYQPTVKTSQTICSPTIRVMPHGAKFCYNEPALIILPLIVNLNANDKVTCLCSDTDINETPNWKQLDSNEFELRDSFINLKTTHFSFFTAIVDKGYPEASKMIFAGIGGSLEVPEVPGVKVTFPGSAIKYDIEATIKVMYADGPYDVDHDDPTSYALAAPVVKLGPTGHQFNPDSIEPVEVQLPLPNGREIYDSCGRPSLTFWQSSTAEGQALEWKLFKTNYRLIKDEDQRLYVCFPVDHFTFFQVLWGILDSVVAEAKIGASFFYPSFEFCISFQAFMTENVDDQTFGLCCLCHRSGSEMESVGNYPVFVGSSGLRMVKSGLLQIRIVSNLFEANADFDEASLVQRELFTGRPFNKQFACKLTGGVANQSTIGKVYIERVLDNSQVEPLFDFLLTKPPPSQERPRSDSTTSNGHINRRTEMYSQSNWEETFSQELANILSIKADHDLGDSVWEDVARGLGYTQLEIDMKFKDNLEDEPLKVVLNDYKKRGGNPNDFVSAMYNVGRKASLGSFEKRLKEEPSGNCRPVEDDLVVCAGSLSPSHTSSSSGVVLPPAPFNSRKRRLADGPEIDVSTAKLSEVAGLVQDKWKWLGRALELREEQLTRIEKDFKTDGVQEQAYQMLYTWKEMYPERGHETLYQALGKTDMKSVARRL